MAERVYEDVFQDQNVELKHLYSGVPHTDYWFLVESFANYFQHLIREDSVPDVVVLHGDEALDRYFESFRCKSWGDRSQWLKVPIVFTGVSCLDTMSSQRYFPEMIMRGFRDSLDFDKNIALAHEIFPDKEICMEIDFYPRDSLYRTRLVGKPMRLVSARDRNANVPGVMPYTVLEGKQKEQADSILHWYMHHASKMSHLQMKFDSYSNAFIDHSGGPQLSCVNAQFGDKRVRILGGHFVRFEIQVKDAASYVMKVLSGTPIESLPIQNSVAETVLDWRAMQMYKMNYVDWYQKAVIVGAPLRVSHPIFFVVLIFIALAFVGFVIFGITLRVMNRVYNSRENRELRDLENTMVWMLKGNNCSIWKVTDKSLQMIAGSKDISPSQYYSREDFVNMIHPDDRDAINRQLDFKESDGKKCHQVRILINDKFFWAEFRYEVTPVAVQERTLLVLVSNITKQKEKEQKTRESLEKAEETQLKEAFLANISHDLRSPLASIVGLADMITSNEYEISVEEKLELSKLVHQNTEAMLTLVNDISDTSKLQIGEYRFMYDAEQVSILLESIFNTYKVLVPDRLAFELKRDVPCTINVDKMRTAQVINNFLSNAIKNTLNGKIVIGWEARGEEVALYVQDTGSGISDELKPHLFESYVKGDGQRDGAGLGLSICKQMVEAQHGRIEVESTVGVGSKFMAIFKRVAMMLLLLLSFTSCQKDRMQTRSDGTAFKVGVLHTYDSAQYVYKEFDEAIKQEFQRNHLKVDITNYYMDMDEYQSASAIDSILYGVLQTPYDMVLLEGDYALYGLLDEAERTLQTDSLGLYSFPWPVVAGSIIGTDWSRIRRFRNLDVWISGLDPRPILPLIVSSTDHNLIEVELDYTPMDSLYRRDLHGILCGKPYLDNLDFKNQDAITAQAQRVTYRDSIIILGVSAAQPEKNGIDDGDLLGDYVGRVEELTNILYNYSCHYPQLVVKKNLWSRELANKTYMPQFTLLPYDFGDVNTSYLAGYFARMAIVAHDIVGTASSILTPEEHSFRHYCGRHQREKFLDYNALELYELDYDDYDNSDWTIVNVPFRVHYPIVAYGVPLTLFFFFVLFCYFLSRRYYMRRYQHVMELRRQLGESNLSLLGGEHFYFKADIAGCILLQEKFTDIHTAEPQNAYQIFIAQMVDPAYASLADEFLQTLQTPGNYTMELPLTLNKEQSYNWWRVTYVVGDVKDGRKFHVQGILLNIDETKQHQKELQSAIKRTKQLQKKENFLNNMNHEIRTPLNAIMGFCDILATDAAFLSEKERQEVSHRIFTNSRYLQTLIQNVLDYSRLESGRMRFNMQQYRIEELLLPFMQAEKDYAEADVFVDDNGCDKSGKLKVDIVSCREGIMVEADAVCVRSVIHLLMSNALKFTESGTIHLGWFHDIQHHCVSVFVEDSGEGMDSESLRYVFQDFYKRRPLDRGVGLGLSICRAMVKGMGGELRMDSAVGIGTQVFFTLKCV